jgi:hypothetical protein
MVLIRVHQRNPRRFGFLNPRESVEIRGNDFAFSMFAAIETFHLPTGTTLVTMH